MFNTNWVAKGNAQPIKCAEGNMPEEDDREPDEGTEDVVDEEPTSTGREDADPGGDDSKDEPQEKVFSQQDVDRVLQKRLKRQEEQLKKQFADYDTLKNDAAEYRKLQDEKATDSERWERERTDLMAKLQERDDKLTKLERATLIADLATERGLPKSFWKRISGESEEDIAEDIDSIVHDLNLDKKPEEKPESKEETPKKKPAPKKVYGGGGESEDPEPDIDQIVAAIPRGPQVRTR